MSEQNWLRRLSKAKDDRWIGGLRRAGRAYPGPLLDLAGDIFDTLFCFGTGLLIYILLWLFMPKETAGADHHE